jgi:hypothetical protein
MIQKKINIQKITTALIKIIGVILLIIGLVAAYYGPMEWHVYSFFSEGGAFHYDGFRMGSAWFGSLVVLNSGYYLIAALCIPLAIGHLKLRRWTVTLSRLYLWFWLGAGVLLLGNLLLLVPSAFELNLIQDFLVFEFGIFAISLLFFTMILPSVGLWFYSSKKVNSLFKKQDTHEYWIDRYPFPLLAVLLLLGMIIIVLHYAIFFQGMFPMFGQLWLGRQPVYLITLCILSIGVLMYGIIQLKAWAWWGTLLAVSALATSTILSFSKYPLYQIILMMKLPEYEINLFNQIPIVHYYHLVNLFAPPLLVTLGLLIHSRKYFGKGLKLPAILLKHRKKLR